jgi:NADPH:quinone reductase-like Zn-dependent oxidoreductase
MITGSKRVEGFWLADFMKRQSIPQTLRIIRQVRSLIRDKVLATDIVASYPLEQVREAVKHAASPAKGGKVLLRVGGR